MPESWWNTLGFKLMSLGVSLMTRRNQRQFALMLMLGTAFKEERPVEHEAIVDGRVTPVFGTAEDHARTVH